MYAKVASSLGESKGRRRRVKRQNNYANILFGVVFGSAFVVSTVLISFNTRGRRCS